MAVAFPSTLRPMAQASKARSQDAIYSIAAPRQARADVGPAGTDKPVIWECQFVYSEAEARVFLDWFVNDLAGGALLAALPIKTEFGLITHEVRFLDEGLLTSKQIGEAWQYTARVMAREQIIPEEALTAYAGAAPEVVGAPAVTAGAPYYLDLAPQWTGGEGPFTWQVVAGVLPSGITLDEFTGVVSGTCAYSTTLSGVVFRRLDVFCQARDAPVGDGDPFWPYVILLAKFQGADGSSAVIDSSIYADHKTCNTGQEIDTTDKRWGASSLLVSRQAPLALQWSAARFARASGEAITYEGWFKSGSAASSTASPMLFGLDAADGGLLIRVSKYGTDPYRMNMRVGIFDTYPDYYTFEPDANGWVYWMIRLAADGTAEKWINTTKVGTVGLSTWPTSGRVLIAGDTVGTGTSGSTCWIGETRITKADRYPDGITELPEEFKTY